MRSVWGWTPASSAATEMTYTASGRSLSGLAMAHHLLCAAHLDHTPRWARGDWPSDAAARASTALRSAADSFWGTASSTVTSRSPVAFLVLTPRPLTRNVR